MTMLEYMITPRSMAEQGFLTMPRSMTMHVSLTMPMSMKTHVYVAMHGYMEMQISLTHVLLDEERSSHKGL